jgi:hypothetical protein
MPDAGSHCLRHHCRIERHKLHGTRDNKKTPEMFHTAGEASRYQLRTKKIAILIGQSTMWCAKRMAIQGNSRLR